MAVMTFGGHEIGDRFLQFNPDRGVLSEVENTTFQVGTADGERFSRSRLKMRVIPVEYDVFTLSRREFERRMAPLLYSKELQELSFSDRDDEYWLAKVDGKIDLDRAYLMGHGTINFIVPDGVSHSKRLSSVNLSSGEPVTVINRGTAPTAPILTATMADDNGLVAWVNERGGVLQFGSPDEVDGVDKQKSERVINQRYSSQPTGAVINQSASNYMYYNGDHKRPNKQRGSFKYGKDSSGGISAIPVFQNGNDGDWGGPSLYMPIKSASSGEQNGNFVYKTRVVFKPTISAMGRIEITLQTGNDVAYAIVLRDSSPSSEDFVVEMFAKNNLLGTTHLTKKVLGTGGYIEAEISRIESKVQYKVAHVKQKPDKGATLDTPYIKAYTLDYMRDVDVDGYSVWFERYQNKQHTISSLLSTSFEWVNVNYWSDLPNRFVAGDTLIADVAHKKIYLNGVEDTTLQTVGNQWDSFLLPSGESKIQTIISDWSKMVESEIQYREAWY